MNTDRDRGQSIQGRRDEERVQRVSGRVCFDMRTSFQSSPVRCTCAGISPAFFGEYGERFLGSRIESEMLLKRGPHFLRSRGLLEYPNPSVPDVYQELRPRAGIAQLPASQHRGPSSVGKLLIRVPPCRGTFTLAPGARFTST